MTEQLEIKIKVDDDNIKTKLNDASEAVNDLGNNVNNASGGFTVFKAALADLASRGIAALANSIKDLSRDVVNIGRDFEASMSEVGAISGATGNDLKKLEDTARKFGETTVFSASECADALKYMSLAGWDSNQSISGLEGVLNLAAASGMDLAEASDMVTDYISAFGLEAEDATRVADLLSYAQSNANTTAKQLGEAYGNCAANMNAAGQSIDTTTALLATLSNQGLKGSEAGTALSAIMRDITNKMQNGAIQIGNTSVKVQDANGNFRDMTDILADVEAATQGMGTAEEAAALSTTFTSRSLSAMNMLLQAGSSETKAFEKQLKNADGTAKKTADTMNDNLNGSIKKMNSAFEDACISAYDLFEGELKDGVDFITNKAIPGFKDFIKELDKKGTIEEFGDAIENIADTALPLLQDGLELFLNVTSFLGDNIELVVGGLSALTAATIAQSVATKAATIAQEGLNASLLLNPFTAAITALGVGIGLMVGFATTTEDATAAIDEANAELIKTRDAGLKAADSMRQLTNAAKEDMVAAQAHAGYCRELYDELSTLVDANGQVKEGEEARAEFIMGQLNDALGTEMTMNGNLIQGYEEVQASIQDLIKQMEAEAYLMANKSAYQEAINSRKSLSDSITAQAQICKSKEDEYYSYVKEAQKQSAAGNDDLAASYQAKANEVKSSLEEEKDKLEELTTSYDENNQLIQQYEAGSAAAIAGDVDSVIKVYEDLENADDVLTKYLGDGWNNRASDADEGADEIRRTNATLNNDNRALYAEAAKDASTGGYKTGKANTDSHAKGTKEGKKDVVSASKDVGTAGVKEFDKSADARSHGSNTAKGFANGITSGQGSVVQAAKSLASAALQELKKKLDINSPSKITYGFGVFYDEGLEDGIRDNIRNIQSAADEAANYALSPLQVGIKANSIESELSSLDITSSITSPIANYSEQLINGLSSALNGDVPIVLTVDGKVFAETSIRTINTLTRQTGSLGLNIM